MQLLPQENIQTQIYTIRNEKVMIDSDLAKLYQIETKVLNQAVKRNIKRVPSDFMFELTKEEKLEVVTNCDHLKNIRFSPVLPKVFIEHGISMLSSILSTDIGLWMLLILMRERMKIL